MWSDTTWEKEESRRWRKEFQIKASLKEDQVWKLLEKCLCQLLKCVRFIFYCLWEVMSWNTPGKVEYLLLLPVSPFFFPQMSGLNNYIIVVKWFEFQTKWGVVRNRKQWREMKFQLNCNLSNRFDRLYSQKGQFSHSTGFLWALFPPDERHSVPCHCSFLAPFSYSHFHFRAPGNVSLKKQ